MFFLTEKLEFPPPQSASPEGIVAVGGDLSPQRLMLAYHSGIFPWFEDDEVLLWWSPDPRMVLFPEQLKVSKSLRQVIRSKKFKVTFNKAFKEVVANCAMIDRPGQDSTWITKGVVDAYSELHNLGHAQSVEVWQEDELVGGVYGVDLGNIFCGESMFSKVSNASKVGFVYLVEKLKREKYKLIDCQVYTKHLESLGAKEIPRKEFLNVLKA
ncbi:leucyl/phenylalanyl-tRNA--protein transferase [Sungkyunkwania multivorans]|uniref:Leucyl/phenylalanyl-tRNA--protein transferase n=1 Tax=Sungkyunkwania multivorans TaxID=1173618 RepID=A0ABW3CU64_9FLAO